MEQKVTMTPILLFQDMLMMVIQYMAHLDLLIKLEGMQFSQNQGTLRMLTVKQIDHLQVFFLQNFLLKILLSTHQIVIMFLMKIMEDFVSPQNIQMGHTLILLLLILHQPQMEYLKILKNHSFHILQVIIINQNQTDLIS